MFKFFKWLKGHDDDDLAYIILFGRPERRRLQQSTSQYQGPARVTHVDRQNLPSERQKKHKETYDEHKNKVEAAQQQKITLEDIIINDFLQRIFFITVNFGKINNVAKNFQI